MDTPRSPRSAFLLFLLLSAGVASSASPRAWNGWTVEDTAGTAGAQLDSNAIWGIRASEWFRRTLVPLEKDPSLGGPGAVRFERFRLWRKGTARSWYTAVLDVRSCCVHRRRVLFDLDEFGVVGSVAEVARRIELPVCREEARTRFLGGDNFRLIAASTCASPEPDSAGVLRGDSSTLDFGIGPTGLRTGPARSWKYRR